MAAENHDAARIIAVARGWIGTPYHHQASAKGVGCDCLGLVRGVFRELYGREPETPPPYTRDWAEMRGEETLRDAARRHLREIPVGQFGAGDVVLFRLRHGPAKHAAIASCEGRMIHAYDRHAVHECALPERVAPAHRLCLPLSLGDFLMAALAFTLGGAALGSALLPGGFSAFGATLSGASIGGVLGGIGGALVDQTLLAPTQRSRGPQISELHVQSSTEGAPILRVFGRMRVGPTVIWATELREERSKKSTSVGGKGSGPRVETTEFRYFATFAIALCEGPIAGIGRVWADGKLLDLSDFDWRLHRGTEAQEPDPRIVAVEGDAPAYRGLAYIVFDDMPLEQFGNRIPQLSVEVVRTPTGGSDRLENSLAAITLIPGAGEFAYDTERVMREEGFAESEPENVHAARAKADALVALDQLEASAPNVRNVALVVAWHGDDLRCASCSIRPRVEFSDKETDPTIWRAGGINRPTALEVSRIDGAPALGGAPSDGAVIRMIRALKQRGYAVTLYPFILMDVPQGNGMTNPYGGDEQPAYPWRGRITCSAAPGRAGSPDKSAVAATEIADFFGAAQPGDFSFNEVQETVDYSGPQHWSYRRFILHFAHLAEAAGGVDTFLIGSEMVGLTTIRGAGGSYPAVAQFCALAEDVRSILGAATKIGYAADWTEYGPHRPVDGSGDVFFRLDELWAHPDIDFVGIDAYLPLADWRDGDDHLDREAGYSSIDDPAYLAANVEGGELFEWYYASAEDREAQQRTPITDGAYGEPWIHRIKDIRSWWANEHHDRPNGVRSSSATAWVPQSKPIWFTEFGCPAVDKGANQPNVFVDPKSSESFFPYFSSRQRDDAGQRAYLESMLAYWRDDANNPASPHYAGRMIDTGRLYAWTFDARPYPQFPNLASVWADAPNWRLGHWLNGRLGSATLADVVAEICSGLGATIDVSALEGTVAGYQIDRIMSPREALAPLMACFAFDAVESGETIRFLPRGSGAAETFGTDDLVAASAGDYRLIRAQESELPLSLKLRFVDLGREYRQGTAESRRLRGETSRIAEESVPVALDQAAASGVADALLMDAHVGRERAELALPPRCLRYDAGDVVALDLNGRITPMRLDSIGWEVGRPARLTRTDPETYKRMDGAAIERELPRLKVAGRPLVEIVDLPVLTAEDDKPAAPWIAAYAEPWTPVAAYRSASGTGYALDTVVEERAGIGALAGPLPRGPVWRWDRGSAIVVDVAPGTALESRPELDVLNGANLAAVRAGDGDWEILQWCTAELIAERRYRLTRLLRGQFGTEHAASDPTPAGSRFVLVDAALARANLSREERNLTLFWRFGPASRPLDDPAYRVQELALGGAGLRPYSPVHLEARRVGGDILVSWVRRTRIGGDSWAGEDVPLGEDRELYRVDVMDGDTAVRTIQTTEPQATYAEAEQIADFGAPLGAVSVAVWQRSQGYGTGTPARATIVL